VVAGRRARPGRGRAAAGPQGRYELEPLVTGAAQARTLAVAFHGEDGRRWSYVFASLPCPGLHTDLAAAFAARTGPVGALRTKASADKAWAAVLRLLNFLGALRRPPRGVAELCPAHLQRYRMHRRVTVAEHGVAMELTQIRLLLREVTPQEKLTAELRDHIRRPGHLIGHYKKRQGRPGYSDRELAALMAAARADVVAIRDRIGKAEGLIAALAAAPDTLTAQERELAAALAGMDRDGTVPHVRRAGGNLFDGAAEVALARHLFLVDADLAPLVIMGVGLSGRNGETVKELPAEHRVLDGRAVAVNLVKRRRGKAVSRETVHWETGATGSRQLHTPGGFYLLLQGLTERGRRFSGNGRIWSVWSAAATRNREAARVKLECLGHIDPFAVRIGRWLELSGWAAQHGLTDDHGRPLQMSLNRLKTAVEVRLTKSLGGHLPSARRTNTMDVSFLHYLRDDPHIRQWAEQILTAAIDDAENSARTFGPRILDRDGQQVLAHDPHAAASALATTTATLISAAGGQLDTLASACLDIDHSPFNPGRCAVSFLTCLRCPNALVTERHLPALLALADELQAALDHMGVDAWSAKYGITWLTLTRLILPRFTAAQQQAAAETKPASLTLDLLDGPKEPR